jgi:hypothetical protein
MPKVSAGSSGSSADLVRKAVEAGDARRRARDVSVRLWRLAPVVAALCVVAAAANWWLRGSPVLPLAIVAGAVAVVAAYAVLQRRARPVSDAAACRLDSEGDFGGELRSAHWFAGRAAGDEWTSLHLHRAAERLRGTDWARLYPPVPVARARVITAALLAAAAAIGVVTPERTRVEARGPFGVPVTGRVLARGKAMPLEAMPDDLRKRIEDLLASAEQGAGSPREQTEAAEMIWNMFTALNSDINAEKLKEVARAMDPTRRADAAQAAKTLKELAGRSLKAADTRELPQDLRDALRQLGEALTTTAEAEQRAAEATASNTPSNSASGNATATDSPASLDDSSIQMSRDQDAGAGTGLMMMSSQMKAMGQPSSGFGGAGNTGAEAPLGVAPEALADALRRETVEASADVTGDNVLSETRRKTERGRAAVGFTQEAAGRSGRSRATAPPPVPEDLRGTVQSYFQRTQ